MFADNVLYEDNHLLVVNKPAPLATMGAAAGETSLLSLAKDYIRDKYNKPGNVYLGVVSRLDSFVSGAIVLARTSKAAARMTRQFQQGEVEKRYWALVQAAPQPASGRLQDWLHKNDERRRMEICATTTPKAKEALLEYHTKMALQDHGAWLEIELITGRKHQIRLQMSERGWGILGDQKYGVERSFGDCGAGKSPKNGIALHSRLLAFTHPVRGDDLVFKAAVPKVWYATPYADMLAQS